ncbi:MAG: hypothetical protein ACREFP_01885 [Acetobacteraceae bacterium]
MDQSGPGELPVERCDVQYKDMLKKYRDLRTKWLGWLEGDPRHAIWRQIFVILSNDLAVRTISCAAENDPDSPLHNPLLRQVILDGHRDTQVLGVRKLMEESSDVISLGRLLKDLRDNIDVFTREIYVAGSGLPYDLNTALSALSSGLSGPGFVPSDHPAPRYFLAKAAHERFDRLSRISPSQRARTNRIPKRLIDHLRNHIENSSAQDTVKWSHQFVAHAGDTKGAGWRNLQLTYEKVVSAQQHVVQVVHWISSELLQAMTLSRLVPVLQFKAYERFDRLVTPESLERARQYRCELEKDRNSWLQESQGTSDLLTVIGWPNALVC